MLGVSAPAGFENYKPVDFRDRTGDLTNRPASPKQSPKVLSADALSLLSLPVIVDDEEPQDSLLMSAFGSVPLSARRSSPLGSPRGGRPVSPVVLTPVNVVSTAQDNKGGPLHPLRKAASSAGLPPTSPSSTPREQSKRTAAHMTSKAFSSSMPNSGGVTSPKGLYGLGMKISDTLPHIVQGVDGLIDENSEPASHKVKPGDILEIVDGIFVTDKSIEDMKNIIAGPYGSVCTLSLRSQPNSIMYTVRAKRHVPCQSPQIEVDMPKPENVVASLRMEPPTTPVLSIRQSFQPSHDGADRLNSRSQSPREEPNAGRKDRERSRAPLAESLSPVLRSEFSKLEMSSLARSSTRAVSQPISQAASSPRLGMLPPVLEVKKNLFTSIHDAMQRARVSGDMVLHRLLSCLDEQVRAVEEEFRKSDVMLRDHIMALEEQLQDAAASAASKENEHIQTVMGLKEQINGLKVLESNSSQFLGQLAQASSREEELLNEQARLREEINELRSMEANSAELVLRLANADEKATKLQKEFEAFRDSQDKSRRKMQEQCDKSNADLSAVRLERDLAVTSADIYRMERDKATAKVTELELAVNKLEANALASRTELDVANARSAELESSLNTSVDLSHVERDQAMSKIEELEHKIKTLELDLRNSRELEDARMARVHELEEQLSRVEELEAELTDMKGLKEDQLSRVEELEAELIDMKGLKEELVKLSKELKAKNTRLEELEADRITKQNQLAEQSVLLLRISELETELEETEIQLAERSKDSRREMRERAVMEEDNIKQSAEENELLRQQLELRSNEVSELKRAADRVASEYQGRLDNAAQQHLEEEARIKRQMEEFSAMLSEVLAGQTDQKIPALEKEIESLKAIRDKEHRMLRMYLGSLPVPLRRPKGAAQVYMI